MNIMFHKWSIHYVFLWLAMKRSRSSRCSNATTTCKDVTSKSARVSKEWSPLALKLLEKWSWGDISVGSLNLDALLLIHF